MQKNFTDHPGYIGKADPIASVAYDWLVSNHDDRKAYSADVARAARKIHKAVIEVLAGLSEHDRHLLTNAKLQTRKAGRPEVGLSLARRIILAVYYVWERSNRDMSIPRGRTRASGSSSELLLICEVMLSLSKLYTKQSTIINIVNAYRRDVLRSDDPDLAFSKETRRPRFSDFAGPNILPKSEP